MNEWLHLLLRWAHFIFGIAWIGNSFYFIWLDSSFDRPEKPSEDVEGELWMVHGGGYYLVQRHFMAPGKLPKKLHWFKWEATFTWITGFLLLIFLYYLTDGTYLLDPAVSSLTPAQGAGIGIGALVTAWVFYDLLWQSRIGRDHAGITTAISFAALGGAIYGLTQVFSGRGAFIHVGSLLGTIMVANVWMRILPSQRKMIAATEAGQRPDYEIGRRGKRRSLHNGYMHFPILFIMISNHYPAIYGHRLNWLLLMLLLFAGAGVRHFLISSYKEAWRTGYAGLAAGLTALAAVVLISGATEARLPPAGGPPVAFHQISAVLRQRCLPCHSANPVDRTFGPSPGGANFDTPQAIKALATQIKVRAVDTKTMPVGNKTGITDDERALLGRWVEGGALLQ